MSIEEAKRVTATSASASFAPPPRTINDITAILDQQKRSDPEASARRQADEAPPNTTAHPIFWAPFTLVGDGGPGATAP